MTGDTIARSRRLDGWQAARIGLVVLWILWAALAWWTSPRHADTERMRADFDTGRVVAFEFADSLDGRGPWGVSLTFRFAPQSNEILVWRTPDWRLHYTTFDLPLDAVDQAGTPLSETHRMIEDYLAGHQDTTLGGTRPALLTYLSLALVLVGLGVLLAGPDPVIGTRWYWFWFGFIPFGLGLLYWLAKERPWTDPPPRPIDRKTGRPARREGLTGFLVQLASGFVVSLVVLGLGALLGNAVVPN
jgi:hypothetical protein